MPKETIDTNKRRNKALFDLPAHVRYPIQERLVSMANKKIYVFTMFLPTSIDLAPTIYCVVILNLFEVYRMFMCNNNLLEMVLNI